MNLAANPQKFGSLDAKLLQSVSQVFTLRLPAAGRIKNILQVWIIVATVVAREECRRHLMLVEKTLWMKSSPVGTKYYKDQVFRVVLLSHHNSSVR